MESASQESQTTKSTMEGTKKSEDQQKGFWTKHGDTVIRGMGVVVLIVTVCVLGSCVANQSPRRGSQQSDPLSTVLLWQATQTNAVQKIPVEAIITARRTELTAAVADTAIRCLSFVGIAGIGAWGIVRLLRDD